MNKTFLNKFPILAISYGLFFLFLATYFSLFESQLFVYQEKTSIFVLSVDFLTENLTQPGGLLVYFTKFLTAFFYYPIAGAIIVSLVITLIVLTISEIIYLLRGKKYPIPALIFGIGLFYLQTNYQFLLIYNLGLLVQLLFFLMSIRYNTHLKGAIPILLAPLCVFMTGGFVWIFLIMTTLNLILQWNIKALIKGLLLLTILSGSFYFFSHFIYFQSINALLLYPFSTVVEGVKFEVYFAIVAVITLLPLLAKVKVTLQKKLRDARVAFYFITFPNLVVALVTVGIIQFDSKTRDYFLVEKLFSQEKYSDVIAYNTAHPSMNILTIFLNNVALCETGKLNDQLFHFPQMPDGSTLFLKWEMQGEVLRRGAYFYYTIGMVNEAQRWAFENMVMKGNTPEGLKMLIKTSLINGNYEMASKYISLLKNTLFYNNDALKYEKFLFNDKLVGSDPDLGEKQKIKMKSDFFVISDNPYVNVERILATDSLNRKAMDYKLAYLLLKKNVKSIAQLLPKLESYGYRKMPVHIEEAALEFKVLKLGPLPQPGNLTFTPETEIRWGDFIVTFKGFNNDLRSAEPALRSKFKDTFWYYAFYH
ncbi:MAG: DUF6057 family protein [Mariniphaga sp.]